MGRTRETSDEWLEHHERVDRVPGRRDPVEQQVRARRLLSVTAPFLGTITAIAAPVIPFQRGR